MGRLAILKSEDKQASDGKAAATVVTPPGGAAKGRQATLRFGIQRRAPLVTLLVVSIVVVLLFLASTTGNSSLIGKTLAPSIVVLIWLACYLVSTYLAFGTVYLFATAYVVCLFMFHMGLFLQDGLGFIKLITWKGEMGEWAVRAGWYTNLALACFGIGFATNGLASRRQAMPTPVTINTVAPQNLAWLRDQGLGLLIAAIFLLAAAIATSGNLLALTRLQLFHLSDTRFISVFSMMAPGAATALLLGARTRKQKILSYVVGVVVMLLFLFSGQRSTALFPAFAAAIVWTKTGRRINPVVAAVAILGTLLLIPMIGYLRDVGTYGDIASTKAIESAAKYANVSGALGEMGGSIGPLMYTLKFIPDEEPYRYGSTYLDYVMDVLPNIGFSPDRSTSRAAAEDLLRTLPEDQALLKMNPGDWASYHIIKNQFASGGGAGYSGVAEPYFNFGLPGVIIFFVALGALLCRLDCLPLILHRAWLAFGAVIFWHLLPTVRNGLAIFLKPAVFAIIVLLIWKLVRRFVPMAAPRPARKPVPVGHAPPTGDQQSRVEPRPAGVRRR
ncbi:MAG: O-antigen polysaccharide polymerase Wzy [Gammaproteobacteria bacterium]